MEKTYINVKLKEQALLKDAYRIENLPGVMKFEQVFPEADDNLALWWIAEVDPARAQEILATIQQDSCVKTASLSAPRKFMK